MKVLLTFVLGLMLMATVCSQIQVNDPERFTYSSRKEEFSVSAPCRLNEIDFEKEWSIYKCNVGLRWFFVTSTTDEASSQLSVIKEQISTDPQHLEFDVGPFKVSKLTFTDFDELHQTVLTARTRERFYIFQAVSDLADDPEINLFVKSIRLDQLVLTPRRTESRSKTILQKLRKPSMDENHMSRERALTLDVPRNELRIEKEQSSPFKIVATTKAAYTHLATIYQVSGGVQLRVTFLSTGVVGSVEPLSKLPLGLTANAIAAAKFTRFEPKVEKGIPLSVAKTMEFGFVEY